MRAKEFIDGIRLAYMDGDLVEVERLNREYGDQRVALRELEEVVSSDSAAVLELFHDQQTQLDFITEILLSAVQEGSITINEELEKEIKEALKTDEGEMSNDE